MLKMLFELLRKSFIFLILLSILCTSAIFSYVYGLDNLITDGNPKKHTSKPFQDALKNNSLIIYVVTSNRSLKQVEKIYDMGYPWRRKYYGKIVNFLTDSGVKLILIDAIYSERSIYRSSEHPNKDGCYKKEDDDSLFAYSLRKSGIVVSGFLFSYPKETFFARQKKELSKIPINKLKYYANALNVSVDNKSKIKLVENIVQKLYLKTKYNKNIEPHSIKLELIYPTISLPSYLRVELPITKLLTSFKHIAYLGIPADSDYITRRTPLLIEYNGKYYPSLSFSAYLAYINFNTKNEKVILKGNHFIVRNKKIPLDSKGNLLIKYYGTNDIYNDFYDIDILTLSDKAKLLYETYKKHIKNPDFPIKTLFQDYHKYQELLNALRTKLGTDKIKQFILNSTERKLINANLKGKIVFYGSIATSLIDLRPTPLNSREIGTHIHASALDNMIKGDFDK
ncbi:MAG: CHASE2 domain-containing protein [Spirochaetota bacterium]|nr:CHASE2 domain-containing protein [Spirochaetota bacterium]